MSEQQDSQHTTPNAEYAPAQASRAGTPLDGAAPSSSAQSEADEARMRREFRVGGVERKLSPEEQLDQLASYIYAHYEQPAKNPPWSDDPSDPAAVDMYDALLPDRITHASMLMLGSGLDHSMPGVAYGTDVTVTEHPELRAQQITPSKPSGVWAVSCHPGGWWKGSGPALSHAWRPEVAAVAELSGITFLDLDYPLVPEHSVAEVIASVRKAAQWAREQGATKVAAWGYSSGGALALLSAAEFDALALTFPHLDLSMLPADVRGEVDFPRSDLPLMLVQVALRDAVADRYTWAESQATVREYLSEHRLSTPEVARQRVRDVAEYLREACE